MLIALVWRMPVVVPTGLGTILDGCFSVCSLLFVMTNAGETCFTDDCPPLIAAHKASAG